ncbi:MAG: glycosyltransferase family 2 protein [Anaerolineales bacterium]|nr:glycosyltransferase family 2 protein [Anaerolineales bacterium]
MPTKPVISVVIPAYNEERVIATCLEHINRAVTQAGVACEVVVSDNNSSDRTAEIATGMGARVVRSTRKGYVHACITGVREAQGEYIAMTDCDTRVPPDWLKKIHAAFQEDPELVGVGGSFEYYDGHPLIRWLVRVLNRISFRFTIASLIGMNMAFKKSAYDAVGGHNSEFSMQADTYLGFELAKQGKVKLLKNNKVDASGRRYATIWGSITETVIRVTNVLWLRLFGKVLVENFADIRE